MEFVSNDIECAICYESFSQSNTCVTPCGHKFCFKCIVNSMSRNPECPICRVSLMEDEVRRRYHGEDSDEEFDEIDFNGDDDDEDDDDDDDDSENSEDITLGTNDTASDDDDESESDEDSDDDEVFPEPEPEEIAARLEESGFDMTDLISILHTKYSKTRHGSSREFRKMYREYDRICTEMTQEYKENHMFRREDVRAVAAAPGPECCKNADAKMTVYKVSEEAFE